MWHPVEWHRAGAHKKLTIIRLIGTRYVASERGTVLTSTLIDTENPILEPPRHAPQPARLGHPPKPLGDCKGPSIAVAQWRCGAVAQWRSGFSSEGRTADQHDAFCIAAWLERATSSRLRSDPRREWLAGQDY
jgi:hypothetical protein